MTKFHFVFIFLLLPFLLFICGVLTPLRLWPLVLAVSALTGPGLLHVVTRAIVQTLEAVGGQARAPGGFLLLGSDWSSPIGGRENQVTGPIRDLIVDG